MCGLAGLMIIGMYVGIFFIIFYGLKINKFNKDKDSIRLNNTDDSDCGFKVLPSIDQSIVIEKHTILAKINKMISVCENQLRQLKVESSKDYQLKRELETVINSYDEIRKIEINDRISLDYATFLFNEGKLRSEHEIQMFDERVAQAKYVSSGDFYREMLEYNECSYYSKKFILGIFLFLTGFIPSCFYGFLEESFILGFFEWQYNILRCAFTPFEGGIVGEGLRLFAILPFILSAPFFIGAGIVTHAALEISHNIQENVYRKKAGFKSEINKNTIIAGVACIPTLVKILKGVC